MFFARFSVSATRKMFGGNEEFTINITDVEVEKLKDDSGEIRYEKVFQWCLPLFGDDDDDKTSLL